MIATKNLTIFITSLMFLFLAKETAAQSDPMENILEEKLSLSIGYGYEYSLHGIRGNYLVSDRVAVMAGFSPLGILTKGKLGGSYAKVGLEYRFPDFIGSNSFLPYLNIFYGVSNFLDLAHFDRITNIFHTEYKTILGPTIGIGTKFKIGKHRKGCGSIGLHYNYTNSKAVENFVTDFYATYRTSVSWAYRSVFFSLGYTRILKSKNLSEEET